MFNQKNLDLALRLVAALILLQTLFYKFTAAPESVYIFTAVGMEPWGRIGIGVMELIAAALLLIPRTVIFGALLSTGVIAGAIFFHLTKLGISVQNDGGKLFALAVIVMVASLALLYMRRDELKALMARVGIGK
ncbi:MAG: DoxX family protein [Saprospiraceae bacterium]|nr:DoxX family protein [Saprospiraceae bacterium]